MTPGFLIDLRQAARSLARAPGFAAVAVLTLGVGLGLATAIYAALKQVVIDPLPFPDADRLMVLLSEVPGSGTDDVWGASTAQFFHFRDNAESLEEIGVTRGTIPVDASIGGAEVRLGVMLASASVHRMIGARAIVGRTLTDADDQPGAPITAVLSESFWRSQLGADPDLVGSTLSAQVGAETLLIVEIVGVVAATGSASFDTADAWWPNQLDPAGPHYNQHDLFLVAKRRPGVSAEAAQAEADGLTDQLADVYPDVYGTLELESVDLPRSEDVGIDGGTLALAAGVALLLVLSLVATSVWRLRGVAGHLTDAGRGATSSRIRQRTRSLLIVAQVALAFVLLVGAGLLLSSFRNLVVADTGIDPRGVVKVNLVPDNDVGSDWWLLLKEIQDTVTALPGVSVAGASQSLPFERGFFGCVAQHFEDAAVVERLNASGESLCGVQDFVTPGYFAAAGIPVLQGRTLTVADFDDPSARGAVVSRSFAARFFPGQSAIGKRLSPYGWDWFTIVGVVGDIHAKSVSEPPTPHVYYPLARIPVEVGWDPLSVALVVRMNLGEPESLLPTLRRTITALDPDIAMTGAEPLSAVVERSTSQDRFMAALLGFAAAAALMLAVVGLYGIVSYLVARRTNEIGLRMAVGAMPDRVRRMMMMASLKLVAVGLAVGLALSLTVAEVLRGVLFGVTPTSPGVYAACAVVLSLAAGLAGWVAAGRASRITPMDALRME